MTLKAGCGLLLAVEMSGCPLELLKDKDLVESFINDLPAKVGMTLVQKARMVFLDAENQIDSGYSGTSILAESHVALHAWHNRGYVSLHLYSCKDFDEKSVLDYTKKFFQPKRIKYECMTQNWLMDDYLDD